MTDIRTETEIQRMLEETKKFVAESHKLESERRKLDKKIWWFPFVVVSSATIGAVVARLIH